MMNRIDAKFKLLQKQGKKAFIAFITAGDPDLKTTIELVLAFEKVGVDIIELGVPFSDPLADGPTIQASYERALSHGTTLAKILQTVGQIRQHSQIPIALMSSYNPIFHFGDVALVKSAQKVGVDGLIIPDLPPEEAGVLIPACRKANLSTVFFLSPTTTAQRLKKISSVSTGFIYYVSLTGVTGARSRLPSDLITKIKTAKQSISKPICVGFGISTPEQVCDLSKVADGVIVGSAIVKAIEKNQGRSQLVQAVANFVSTLTNART